MTTQLKIDLLVDDKGSVKIKQFSGNLQKETRQMETGFESLSKKANAFFGVLAGVVAGGAILSGIKNVTTAYMEQERAVNKMTVAMKNQGDFSKAGLQDMETFATQIQETTAVADEQALAVMANLKSYGMLNDEVKRAAQVAFDFAAAKKEEGMTIEAASELLGKAYMGQTDRLKRYGIVIDDTLKGSQKFEAVMAQLQQRFGGAAAAELDTYEGRWKNLNNTWGEVKESLGAIALGIADPLIPLLKTLTKEAQEAADALNLAFGSGREAQTSRKRMAILDQIEQAEAELRQYKELVALEGGRGTELGILSAGGGSASAAAAQIPIVEARIAALHQDLKNLSIAAHQAELDAAKIQPGGKRTIPPAEIDKAALAEQKKFAAEQERALSAAYEGEAKTAAAGYYGDLNEWEKERTRNFEREADKKTKLEELSAKNRMTIFEAIGADEEKAWAGHYDALVKKTKSASDEMTVAITGWANNFSSDLNDILWGADLSFGNIAKSFAKMITQMVIQVHVIEPLLKKVFSPGTGGGSFDWFGLVLKGASAASGAGGYTGAEMNSMSWLSKGGVFDKGLVPFAGGGVVMRPSIFPFAGGVGLMGEKGAEAIMPLTRTAAGDLGVKSLGGGVKVEIHNYNNSQITTEASPDGSMLKVIVEKMTLDAIRKNTDAVADAWTSEARGGNRAIMNTLRRLG